MNKNYIFLIFLLLSSTCYSQINMSIEDYNKHILINDSLKRELNKYKAELNSKTDSLKRELSKYKAELNSKTDSLKRYKDLLYKFDKKMKLEQRVKALEKDSISQSQRFSDAKNEIAVLKAQLSVKRDSIINFAKEVKYLNQIKNDKIKEIENLKHSLDEERINSFIKGRNAILDQIKLFYTQKNIEEILQTSNFEFIKKDFEILNDTSNTHFKNILSYYDAVKIFSEKYSEENIEKSKKILDKLHLENELVKSVNEKLKNYKTRQDKVKTLIENLIKFDEKVKASESSLQVQKLSDIVYKISEYMKTFNFRFNNYPFITNIISELIERKTKDADADISDLLNRF